MADTDPTIRNGRMADTDRELLELAARAAGMSLQPFPHPWGLLVWQKGGGIGSPVWWNPLNDDGDALRLAMRCRIVWGWHSSNAVWARGEFHGVAVHESHERRGVQDELAALRRAIVRAAAEIGRAKT